MSFADSLLLFAALAVALTTKWNVTAGALATQYFFLRGVWWAFGIVLPVQWQVLIDLTVITVVCCKSPVRDCFPYGTFGRQVCAFWVERSMWDRIVLSCFPLMWVAYLLPHYPSWWACWGLALAQYLAAGAEASSSFLSTRSAKVGSDKPGDTGTLGFTTERERWEYG